MTHTHRSALTVRLSPRGQGCWFHPGGRCGWLPGGGGRASGGGSVNSHSHPHWECPASERVFGEIDKGEGAGCVLYSFPDSEFWDTCLLLAVALLLVGKPGLHRRGVCGIFGCLVAGCGVALPLLDLLSLWAGERPQRDCPRLQLPPREPTTSLTNALQQSCPFSGAVSSS